MEANQEMLIYGAEWMERDGDGVRLIVSHCDSCGSSWFPKRGVCPKCFSGNLVEKPLSEEGEIYSFTRLHVTSKRFKPPLVIAYVDFPEDVRVCGQVEGEPVEIGSKVEIVFGQIRTEPDGRPVYSYKFRVKPKEAGHQ